MRGKTARRCAWTRPRWRRGKEKGANGCCRVGGVCRNGAVTPYFVATRRSLCRCFLAQGCSAGFPPFCPADRNNASRGARNSEGAGEVHCATRRWCPVVSVDETAVAEREGKRSSTGHMNVAGWARESAPMASVQMAPSMLRPRNRPTCPCAYCRDLNIEGAVRADAP